MATSKQYIGNGKTTKHEGVQVSIRMEDAEKFLRKSASGTWLNFIVRPRMQTDNYGRTHTAFVLVDQPEGEPKPENKPEPVTAAAEPGTPVGEYAEVNGKKMRRIGKADAEKRKAAKAKA